VTRTTIPRHPERSEWVPARSAKVMASVLDGFQSDVAVFGGMRFARGFPIGDPIGIERMRPIDVAHSRSLGMTGYFWDGFIILEATSSAIWSTDGAIVSRYTFGDTGIG